MATNERLLFGFSYHRVGHTDRWRPGGSTLGRLGPDGSQESLGVRLGQHGDHIVWIDVIVECEADRDIDELSRTSEAQANDEFRRLYPGAELAGTK